MESEAQEDSVEPKSGMTNQELIKHIQNLEQEFGQKRARFIELYRKKEGELSETKKENASVAEKNTKLAQEMESLKAELQDVQMAAAILEQGKFDEIERVHKVYEEEMASLHSIMEAAADEASTSTAAKYELEKSKLMDMNKRLLHQMNELRSQPRDSPSFLSTVSKSLKRVRGITGQDQEPENLEDSFRKVLAQEDAEVLRSVVLPLEEEVKALKQKLRETDAKLQQYESVKKSGSMRNSPSKDSLTADLSPEEVEDKLKELSTTLKAEKSSRTDLEMYVAVLDTQKRALSEDTDKLRTELHEVCALLEVERKAHRDLKVTWQMANDQFLESQRLMMMDMRRMESVLSTEQQRQISELQKKDLEREAQEKLVKDLQERQRQAEAEQQNCETEKTSRIVEVTVDECEPSVKSEDLFGAFQKANFTDIPTVSTTNTLQVNEDDSDRISINSAEGMLARISPDKVISVPGLTEAQHRAITAPTPESEESKSLVASVRQPAVDDGLLDGRRMVSEKEWLMLQQELHSARTKLGRTCDMCSNYEAQLVEVQNEQKDVADSLKSCQKELELERTMVERLKKERDDLEGSLKNAAEDAQKQITDLSFKVLTSGKTVSELQTLYSGLQQEMTEQLSNLTAGREDVNKELLRLQRHNDELIGLHSKHAQQLQTEDIDLPNNLEDMQLLLLKYREEIITAKVAREHIEGNLKSEIMFLKDQVHSEHEEKTRIEENLSQEISSLEEKLAMHQSVRSELERESKVRNEAESKVKDTEQQLRSIQAKSKQLIHALTIQLEEQTKERTSLEQGNSKLRGKVQSLQVDLDNSEAVQRDFVKLSQSLQVQLEKIRQAETEVRWQHEDDIEDCTSCKQPFTVTRRKHHCRHCGKIFCAECTSKVVYGGPNMRQSKVCDVCHTILVKDATPYFSKEPPATPD